MTKYTWQRTAAVALADIKATGTAVITPGQKSTRALRSNQLKLVYRYFPDGMYRTAYHINGKVIFLLLANDPAVGFARVEVIMRALASRSEDPEKVKNDTDKMRRITNAQHELNIPELEWDVKPWAIFGSNDAAAPTT